MNENATITANISAEPGAAGQAITVNFYEASRTGNIAGYNLTPESVSHTLTAGNNQIMATLTNNNSNNNGTIRINVSISSFNTTKISVTGSNPTASDNITLKPAN